jgi:sortase A
MHRGDEVFVEAPGGPIVRFLVQELSVVDSRSAVIHRNPRTAALVLMTCYPFDALVAGGPLRYVVTARATDEQGPPSGARP